MRKTKLAATSVEILNVSIPPFTGGALEPANIGTEVTIEDITS